MKIFLIGFMGCGKTTLGKKLASKMDYAFIDVDKEFENQTGTTIAAYFAAHGEDGFRRKESEVLQQTDYPEKSIIATGGGAPCFFDNMDWMNKNGLTLYLSLSPKALASRLEGAAEERPLIKGLKGQQLEDFIAGKLAEREAYYNKAELVIAGLNQTPEKVAQIVEPYLK
ncbi:shikimate kinase [Pedobacter sp. SYSU D00535]|uniref:shikimate kinase n=1 Tax=Pedobacter sp. SYSU D00535 TaxID=2810308 RepID=UPI001A95D7BD|nr:shikimate kinase [Pedobacter sp. SYSU D00535]